MNILILAHNAEGLYRPRRELMQALKKDGHNITVSIPRENYYEEVSSLVDEVVDTPIERRGKNPVKDLKLLYFYHRLMKKMKPDCVLSYAIKPNLYGGMAAQKNHIPYMPNITGLGTAFDKAGPIRALIVRIYRKIAEKAQCAFLQNEANKEALEKFGICWKKSILLPGSGINLNEYNAFDYPSDSGKFRFLYISRIMRDKGIHELMYAAHRLGEQFENLEFHILGYCEDGYTEKMSEWAKAKNVIYHGSQNDVRPFLKMCDCIVHPSYHEGMSNVCLEAAASARPILASDIPGCKETFDDGITGIGFTPRDANSLENAIKRFMRLPYEERKNMGLRGRKKVEREFDRRIVINAYLKEIQKIEKKVS